MADTFREGRSRAESLPKNIRYGRSLWRSGSEPGKAVGANGSFRYQCKLSLIHI